MPERQCKLFQTTEPRNLSGGGTNLLDLMKEGVEQPDQPGGYFTPVADAD